MNRHVLRRGSVALVSLAVLGATAASGAGASAPDGATVTGHHAPGRRPLEARAWRR